MEQSLQLPQPDTFRVRTLNRPAFLLRNSQIEKARTYAEAAYKLAQSTSYKRGIDYLQKSYDIKAAINEQFTLARLLNSIGMLT